MHALFDAINAPARGQSERALVPFVELPDLVVQAPPRLDGPAISAINVDARLGVRGNPIPVQRSAAFGDALREMVAVVRADGVEVDRGKGSDVPWLAGRSGGQGQFQMMDKA